MSDHSRSGVAGPPPVAESIRVRGARVHNLKDIDVDIPRDQLVVITGPSGSGKSSLAFDTLFAEGQRQYIESLSLYARQFLHQMQRPDADLIDGLPPTIAIHQRAGGPNPRSTLATMTEVHDYLRLLFARVGQPSCVQCGQPICQQTPDEIEASLRELPEGTKAMILAPMVRGHKGQHRSVLEAIRKAGFLRVQVDGVLYAIEETPALAPERSHHIEVVVDRLILRQGISARVTESIRTAVRHGDGLVLVMTLDPDERPATDRQPRGRQTLGDRAGSGARGQGVWRERLFSTKYACPDCKTSLAELEPRLFSYNSPYGACPACQGLGVRQRFDPELVVLDRQLSLAAGAILPWRDATAKAQDRHRKELDPLLKAARFDWETPLSRLSAQQSEQLLTGAGGGCPGVLTLLEKQYATETRGARRERLEAFRTTMPCTECGGARLRPEARACRVGGKAIHEIAAMTITAARVFLAGLTWTSAQTGIATPITTEILRRLEFLEKVGAEYLTLDRPADTLSGGEMQRVRLATGVGSGLVGICYLLDEPSIGLHPRDNQRLIDALRELKAQGNTVVVVEHDAAMMNQADHVIDMGPGAGQHGGQVVCQGTPDDVRRDPASKTGRYLSGQLQIPVPAQRRRTSKSRALELIGSTTHNLKNVHVHFPLGALVCVTGVSGSGKSSLVIETLAKAAARRLGQGGPRPGPHSGLRGIKHVDRLVLIDQTPIGRTPRSNAATYTGAFDEIRKVFAATKVARQRGYRAGRFSFNVRGGRCETCQGQGVQRIEMQFLPDLYATCPECEGKRFARQTLQVRYRDRSIADVLEMRVSEGLTFFQNHATIARLLSSLVQVGLDYMPLGQPATTLSGGEAQRIKLATELGRPHARSTLYVLDEPTTGLHFSDIHTLLDVLQQLVDQGHTVLVIEHNLDVIKTADWIIDLGPEGGDLGGQVVATGTPEQIAAAAGNHTGAFLRSVLAAGPPG